MATQKSVKAIAKDITWMLANTVTDGYYETRPIWALQIWQEEENVKLSEERVNEVLNLIEW